MKSARFGTLLGMLVLMLAGCELVAGLTGDYKLEGETTGTGGAGGGTSGVGGSGGAGGSMTCAHSTPPARPTAGSGTGTPTEFVTALYDVNLGEDVSEAIGFDLDGLCTCETEGPGCVQPTWVKKEPCDRPGGRDNGSGAAFAKVNSLQSVISSAAIQGQAQQGQWSLLIRVRDYNGLSDDDQVRVAVYGTNGATTLPPLWDGNDTWTVQSTSLTDGMSLDAPVSEDTTAYVSGGILVAKLTGTPILVRGGGVRLGIEVGKVTLSARIEAMGGGLRLVDGTLGGLWSMSELFRTVSGLRYSNDSALCTTDFLYPTVKQAFCSLIDSSSSGDPTSTCDALSFGMTFTAEPAKLGAVVKPDAPPPSPCTMTNDPISDMCP